mmetsp:Transcript_2317/g.8141  ORF Transcript_2317/g.8141 Transcript_2317/m.8141 type:complete len:220 (+) Transcript_2317:1032-1691(+)
MGRRAGRALQAAVRAAAARERPGGAGDRRLPGQARRGPGAHAGRPRGVQRLALHALSTLPGGRGGAPQRGAARASEARGLHSARRARARWRVPLLHLELNRGRTAPAPHRPQVGRPRRQVRTLCAPPPAPAATQRQQPRSASRPPPTPNPAAASPTAALPLHHVFSLSSPSTPPRRPEHCVPRRGSAASKCPFPHSLPAGTLRLPAAPAGVAISCSCCD